jgi:uncharacterized protein (TIGR03083 family)
MTDLLGVYAAARQDLLDLVGGLPPEQLATTVPATPGWTVHDVVAHLASDVTGLVTDDFPAQFFLEFGQPAAVEVLNAWTARMVEQRRELSLAQLAAQWDHDTAVLVGPDRPAGIPPFADSVLVTDLAVHTHDVHGALGTTGDRESAAVRIATSSYPAGLAWWQPSLPALQIVTEAKTYSCGSGTDPVTLRTSRFELFRALSGRRTPDQLRALDWDGDPDPYLPMFAPYGTRPDPLVE